MTEVEGKKKMCSRARAASASTPILGDWELLLRQEGGKQETL